MQQNTGDSRFSETIYARLGPLVGKITTKRPVWAIFFASLRKVARLTGLEPATPGVTGRYSNQLSYNRALGSFPDPFARIKG